MIGKMSRAALRASAASLIVFAATALAAAPPEGARLVSSSRGSVSFEVAVPAPRVVPAGDGSVRVLIDGFGTFSPPGAVELPGRTFHVAIPAAGAWHLSVSVLEEEDLGRLSLARVYGERLIDDGDGIPVSERYLPPDPWREGGAPPLAAAREPSFMGRQRVLPVRVNPLSVDERGEAHLARRVVLTVSFEPVRATTGADAPLSGAWKRLYDALLVNAGDVEGYESVVAEARAAAEPSRDG